MSHIWELTSSMKTQKSAVPCIQDGLTFSWKHHGHVDQGSLAAVTVSCGGRHREQLSPPQEFAALPAGPFARLCHCLQMGQHVQEQSLGQRGRSKNSS